MICSNAGISITGGLEVSDADWERIWSINVKAHLYAARAVIPGMLARGGGYLLHTVSAAGLLSQIGSAPYSVTKHAALALAEWFAITYGDRGIKVSCLCPQGVRTDMLLRHDGRRGGGGLAAAGAVGPRHDHLERVAAVGALDRVGASGRAVDRAAVRTVAVTTLPLIGVGGCG